MPQAIDPAILQSLLLGKLPPDEAEQLIAQLESDSSDSLSALAMQISGGKDTLVEALRSQSTASDIQPDARVTKLMERLARLWEPENTAAQATGDGTQFLESRTSNPALSFLSRSQSANELGRIGGYSIKRVLGEGGMGMVLLAEDPKLKRQVAIKVMKPEIAVNEQAKERFTREARATAAVEHDHVIAVHQVGEEGGIPFLVMPLLRGESLDDRLKREPRPPLSEALRIGREIAEGLAAAHATGLIHRDIKPANVWLESKSPATSGRVKILDFGLARGGEHADARLTQSGMVVGTPAYMSPEQANGDPVDGRGDLFSLGCILYQMTVGEKPFNGTTIMAILSALASHNPVPPHLRNPQVPPDLSALIMRLLAKRPEQRLASAESVALEIAGIERRLQMQAVPVAQPVEATAVEAPNPWEDIEENSEPGISDKVPASAGETSAAIASPPAKAGAQLPRARSLRPVLIAAGIIALAAVVLFATGIIRIETPKGTLVIEGADDDVEVVIKQNGAVIKDKVKAREIELKVGDYQIELAERGDGLRLETNQFTITRGERKPIKVYLDKAVAKKEPAAKGDDPDREAAEYVLSVGGRVRVNGEDLDIKAAASLPKDRFTLSLVDLYINMAVTDAGLAHFKNCTGVRTLILGHTAVTDAGLAHFKDCKGLTYLMLNGTAVTDAGLAHFKGCNGLTYLGLLYDTQVTDAGLAHFKDCKGLTQLELYRTNVTDAGLVYFKDCKGLTYIHLGVTKVTEASLPVLAGFSRLGCLDLSETRITDRGLEHVKALPQLADLRLKGTKVTAAGVKNLASALPGCKIEWDGGVIEPKSPADPDRKAAEWVLSVGGAIEPIVDGKLLVGGVRKVQDLPASRFGIGNIILAAGNQVQNLDDAALENLRGVTGVTYSIQLGGQPITDAGLERLSTFPGLADSLEGLGLDGTRITDAGLAHLQRFRKIAHLTLDSTAITDAGLDHLKGMRLLTLNVSKTRISAEGFEKLAALRSLTILWAFQTKLMAADLQKLVAVLPNCRIESDHGVFQPKSPAPVPVAAGPSPLDKLDPANIPAAERFPWQPKELVGVFGEGRNRHWGSVNAVAISPDGTLVAAGNGTLIHLWDVKAKHVRSVLHGHTQQVRQLAFADDSRTLLSTDNQEQGEVKRWDVTTGRELDLGPAGKRPMFWPTLSANGKYLVFADVNNGPKSLLVWQPGETQPVCTIPASDRWSWRFSPDGSVLVTVDEPGGQIRVWDAATAKETAVLEGHGVDPRRGTLLHPAVAPGGKAVASAYLPEGGKEWQVKLWDPATGKARPVPTELAKSGIHSLAFGRDGKELFIIRALPQAIRVVEACDVARAERRTAVSFNDDGENPLAVSADGATVAVGTGSSKVVYLFDMKAGKAAGTLGVPGRVWMAAFSPHGTSLAVAGHDIGLQLWDTASGKMRRLGDHPKFDAVVFSPDGRKAAVTAHPDGVHVWESDTDKMLSTTAGAVLGAFTPNSGGVVLWVRDRGLVLLDAETGEERAFITKEQAWNGGPVIAVHGDTLAVALHQKGEVLLWDLKDRKEVGRLRRMPTDLRELAFTPDGQFLACCSIHFSGVKLWHVKTDRESISLEEPDKKPQFHSIAVSPDGRLVAAGSWIGVLCVWERSSGRLLHHWTKQNGYRAVFAPDSRHMAIPNPDGTVYLLRLAPPPKAKAAFPPLDPAWLKKVQALNPHEQAKEVAAELKRRNPKFDDSKVGPVKQPDGSYRVGISTDEVTDISPVRGLSAVKGLYLAGSGAAKGQLVDLEPLRGLPLTHLALHHNPRLSDLTPLAGMPLEELRLLNTDVADLEPLRGLKQLRSLDHASLREIDLTPLEGLPIERFTLWSARVKNIAVLERLPLKYLNVSQFQIVPEPTRQALRNKATLETINDKPAAEFWTEYDAKKGETPKK